MSFLSLLERKRHLVGIMRAVETWETESLLVVVRCVATIAIHLPPAPPH
jgi:hypothetical protein